MTTQTLRRLWRLAMALWLCAFCLALVLLPLLLDPLPRNRMASDVVGAVAALALGLTTGTIIWIHWTSRRSTIERPWLPWAGVYYGRLGLSPAEVVEARARAKEVAARILGATAWNTLQHQGYLDIPSRFYTGVHYRVRPGRRIEITLTEPAKADDLPWGGRRYLCVYPRYDLPEIEFAAQCVLRLRADEAQVLQTGNVLATDGPIYHVF